VGKGGGVKEGKRERVEFFFFLGLRALAKKRKRKRENEKNSPRLGAVAASRARILLASSTCAALTCYRRGRELGFFDRRGKKERKKERKKGRKIRT